MLEAFKLANPTPTNAEKVPAEAKIAMTEIAVIASIPRPIKTLLIHLGAFPLESTKLTGLLLQ